jgi:uncharacterized protein DUF2867
MIFKNVTSEELPDSSLLHPRVKPGDFIDCYACKSSLTARQAGEVLVRFPKWFYPLFLLRQLLVAPFGLKGPDKSGRRLGMFPVETKTPNEIILGFDDTHLNFRISVLSDGTRVFATTWVKFNSRFGRFYLWLIKPFHVLIMKDSIARVARASRPALA